MNLEVLRHKYFFLQVFAINQTDNTVEGINLQSLGKLKGKEARPLILVEVYCFFCRL